MTKIKICGIKTTHDALTAVQLGADLIGFNFYPKSPRYIEVGQCRDIMSTLRKYGHIKFIGVFVNTPAAEILATLETCGLSLAQLHGDETPEMVTSFGGKAYKAVRLSASESTESSVYPARPRQGVLESAPQSAAPALLIDAAVQGVYGGSGVTTDWSIAAELAKKYPLLLAGGLTPENVSEAIRRVRPWGVDVASGVESSPGEKDPEKMKRFIAAVRAVDSNQEKNP